MRACNLLLAYVKDRLLYGGAAGDGYGLAQAICLPAREKFLQTLFQIRDADLVAWWNWLDGEMGKDEAR